MSLMVRNLHHACKLVRILPVASSLQTQRCLHHCAAGGMVGMLALNGIFILVTRHGLEYPAFYERLYALLTADAFQVRHACILAPASVAEGLQYPEQSHRARTRYMPADAGKTATLTLTSTVGCRVWHATEPPDTSSASCTSVIQQPATAQPLTCGLGRTPCHVQGTLRVRSSQAKHRARFFQLVDVFLASGLVPAYTAAAFAKRFARLALAAPPAGAAVAVAFVHNLLRRHPACNILLHRHGSPARLHALSVSVVLSIGKQ